MPKKLAVAIDLGATRMRACIGDGKGRLLKRITREMEVRGRAEDYLSGLIEAVKEVLGRTPHRDVRGIGVASIGPLDLRRGGISKPANLPYRFIPLTRSLSDAFDLEVTLVNDANAAALAEKTYGAGRKEENLVYVTLSTGIGGGAIVDGHLLLGKDGNAGEIGHMTIDRSGMLRCGCGGRGHWEAYCSGRHIPDFARLLIGGLSESQRRNFRGSRFLSEPVSSTPELFQEVAEGDRLARFIVAEIGKMNAIGVANLISLYDPSLITLGGGVAINNPRWVLGPIRRLVPKHTINRTPRIMITPLGDDAGLLGALSVAFEPGLVGR
jgi:glucokinase